MKTFRSLVLAAFLVVLGTGAAHAIAYSPNLTIIQDFDVIESLPASSAIIDPAPKLITDWVKIDGRFENSVTGPAKVYIGISQVIDSSYDSLAMQLANYNGNSWEFGLWVSNGTTTLETDPALTMANDKIFRYFKLDLTGFTGITSFGYYVGGNLPVSGYDRSFETGVAPVPEPGTLLLLGSGLVGLAYLKRRKKA